MLPGMRQRVAVRVGQHYAQGDVVVPTFVVNGRKPGPVMFVAAAIHGDEINGVEIVRRLLRLSAMKRLRGALIAIPVVNIYGFAMQTRYLPDRRDLNRSFPGSATGSLAARLADTFMCEIARHCTHGIDLHTAAVHRTNLPQIRACLDEPETERLAHAFGAPVILNADVRDGSLRQAVLEEKIPMLLYEAGEALRFDEVSIKAGVRGVVSVMRAIDMLPAIESKRPPIRPLVARSSQWVRAPSGGLLYNGVGLGARVAKGDTLVTIVDPLQQTEARVESPVAGIVIGRTQLPLLNEGDALYHLALFDQTAKAARRVEAFQAAYDPDDTLND